MVRAIDIFAAQPGRARKSRKAFLFVACGGTVLSAAALHLFWFSYFWQQDLLGLVVANGVGLAVSLLLFWWSRQGAFPLVGALLCVELALCCTYAAVHLGWDSGCQWFIPVILLPHYLYLSSPRPLRNALTLATLFLFLFAYFFTHARAGLYGDREFVVLRFCNTLLVFLLPLLEAAVFARLQSPGQVLYRQRAHPAGADCEVDSLTRLWNRPFAEKYFPMISDNASSYCFAMVNIDHFQAICDTYGRQAGDQVLRSLSSQLKNRFRSSDIAVRWGGDEFLIVLHRTELAVARQVMDSFRQSVARQPVEVDGRQIRFTVTIGLAEHARGSGRTPAQMIQECGQSLRKGKGNGRNQVVCPVYL